MIRNVIHHSAVCVEIYQACARDAVRNLITVPFNQTLADKQSLDQPLEAFYPTQGLAMLLHPKSCSQKLS